MRTKKIGGAWALVIFVLSPCRRLSRSARPLPQDLGTCRRRKPTSSRRWTASSTSFPMASVRVRPSPSARRPGSPCPSAIAVGMLRKGKPAALVHRVLVRMHSGCLRGVALEGRHAVHPRQHYWPSAFFNLRSAPTAKRRGAPLFPVGGAPCRRVDLWRGRPLHGCRQSSAVRRRHAPRRTVPRSGIATPFTNVSPVTKFGIVIAIFISISYGLCSYGLHNYGLHNYGP